MDRIRPYLIPLTLFIFSFILRLSLISKGPYHVDCFDLAMKSQATLDTLQIHYLYGSGYPFTVILGAFFILLLKPLGISDPITAVNFMSVTFGALCIPALYGVSSKLTGKVAALFSALMFSVIPVFLGVSVYGKNHAPSLFFLLMSIYFIFRYSERKNMSDIILCGISLGLLGATRSQDLILMIPALCYIYFYSPVMPVRPSTPDDKKRTLKNFIFMWLLAGTIIISLHLPTLLQKHAASYKTQFGEFWQTGLLENFMWLDLEILNWGLYLTVNNFTVGGLILAVVGIAAIRQENKRAFIFLLLWLIVPMFFYANLRSTVERFLIISYLPLVIGQGYLLDRLRQWSPWFKHLSLIIFAGLFFMLLTDIFPTLHFRHLNDLLTDYAKWVEKKTEPNAVIIIADENVIIQHYARRETMEQLLSLFGPITKEQLDAYRATLDNYFQEGKKVYITGTGLTANNPEGTFEDFLRRNYQVKLIGKHLFQDWHLGETYHQVYPMRLLQISPK